MTYSLDFRQKVIYVRAREGLTVTQTAEHFGIGLARVQRWMTKLEPQRTWIKPATKIDRIALARDVREHPDSYIYKRAARLGARKSGVASALERIGITFKKNLHHPKANEKDRKIFQKKYN